MDERLVDGEPKYVLTPQTALELYNNKTNDSGENRQEGDSRLLGDSVADRPPDINTRPPGLRRKKQRDPYKGYVKLCVSGLVLIVGAFLIHFIDPVQFAREHTMTMKDGSYLFEMWKAPPIKLYIKIFIFNITNAENFMKGLDKKLKVDEIGPYTYSEVVTNEKVVWNDNDTISFTPKRTVQFEREMSVGDPKEDIIVIPNVPLLGLASMMHQSSAGLNLAASTLISYLDSQPILRMPIHSFLWGYEDPLVKLGQSVVPTWIDFKQFGLLDRMMDEGVNRMTISLKNTNETKQFSIQRFNGQPGLKVWGYSADRDRNSSNRCSMVEGTSEGYLFPRDIPRGTKFTVYRKAFCRPLRLEYVRDGWSEVGYPVYHYKFADDVLDPANPENACYCRPEDGPCLPKGLSDLSPCYYNIPVAISLPHFLYANKSFSEAIDGLAPNPEKHDTVFVIQPDVGVPVFVKTRIQLNLVVKKTRLIPRTKPFNNMVIPIFWMQVELHGLPFSVNFLMVLLLRIGPVVQQTAIISSFVVGLLLVFLANLRYAWDSGIFNSHRTATLISYRQKQRNQDRVIWRSTRYSYLLGQMQQELPPPAAVNQEARSR